MSAQPPRFVERLLRWSLSHADRPTVMGDLQEEFGAIETARGATAACRWYRSQAASSIVPNVLRRGQQAWNASRRIVDADDLRHRRGLRKAAMWCVSIGVVLGLLWSAISADLTALAVTLAFAVPIALILLTGSCFRDMPRRRRSEPWRGRLFWALLWISWVGQFFGVKLPDLLSIALLILPVVILIWPDRYWPRRKSSLMPTEYWVRTPAVATSRERNGNVYVLAPMPATMLAMSRPILGRAVPVRIAPDDVIPGVTPMLTTLDRTFDRHETLRLVAIVNAKNGPVSAELAVIDQTKRTVATLTAAVTPATLQRPVRYARTGAEELDVDDTKAPPFGQIDVTVPLADLPPGGYRLRLVANDGFFTSTQDAGITVKAAPVTP